MTTLSTLNTLVTLFLALHLLAADHPANGSEAAWLAAEGRGELVWEVGVCLNLVTAAERPWHTIHPLNPLNDFRHDLDTLRGRVRPRAVPVRMPG